MKNTNTRPDVLVLTRGFLHPLPAEVAPADITLDLRRTLADPAHRPHGDMLDMTGLQAEVRDFVLATPGAKKTLRQAVRLVRAAAAVKPVVVMLGCAGGKHRAAAMGELLAARLRRRGWQFWARALRVEVRHLHVHLPRVVRADEFAA
jgi:UPF0042 nucleotide-binding protein